ncbi:MAG: tyrosine-type recombinase/integrase [Bryobacteraceae bacterium]
MNGSVTKYKQKNGRTSWGYHFRPSKDANGKWIRVAKQGFETKREAEECLADAIAAYRKGHLPKAPHAAEETFAEFFEVWMKEYAQRHCSPKTAERYGELGQYAIRHFGDVPLSKVRPFALETAFNALLDHGGRKTPAHPGGRPLAPKTVREIAFLVYGVFKKAKAWEKVDTNPADFEKITLPKVERKAVNVVEKGSFRTLSAKATSTRLYPLPVLAAATGARRGELLALQWPDLNFDTGLMLVTKSLEETKLGLRIKSTKSGKPREFVVPRQALEVLIEHRERQERDKAVVGVDYADHQLVFCRRDGEYYKPDKVSVRMTELSKKCGLDGVGLHTLRHTHASELLSRGVPLAVVSDRLGHANPNVTLSIYTHPLKADKLAAAKVWEDAMADVIETKMKEPDAKRVSGSVMTKLKKTS